MVNNPFFCRLKNPITMIMKPYTKNWANLEENKWFYTKELDKRIYVAGEANMDDVCNPSFCMTWDFTDVLGTSP